MEKITGVVMKISEDKLVLLCEDGKFRNIPLPQIIPQLGEKIEVPETSETPKTELISKEEKKVVLSPWFKRQKYWTYAASIVVLAGIFLLVRMLFVSASPVAIVTVDINPGVEMKIDRKSKVTEVILLNDDAKLLLEEKQLTGKPIHEAIHTIITLAEQEGYLNPTTTDQYVFVSVHDLKGANSIQIDPQQIISQEQPYHVEVFTVNEEQLERARENGLSMNKYVVYEQAKEQGVQIDMDQLRTKSIVKSVSEAGVNPQQFIEKAKKSNVNQLSNQSDESNGKASKNAGRSKSEGKEKGNNNNKSNQRSENDQMDRKTNKRDDELQDDRKNERSENRPPNQKGDRNQRGDRDPKGHGRDENKNERSKGNKQHEQNRSRGE